MSKDSETWWSRAVRVYMDRTGKKQVEVARLLGVDKSKVTKWLSYRTIPDPDDVERYLAALGGDIARSFPGWEPPPVAPKAKKLAELQSTIDAKAGKPKPFAGGATLAMIGHVNAGAGTVAIEQTGEFRTLDDLVTDHPHWRLGVGDALLLRVDGDSMEPEFPDGSYIVARQVADPRKVPDDALVIMRNEDLNETTFKRLLRVNDGERVVGIPINRRVRPVEWPGKKTRLTHIVVGAVRR